MGEDVLPAEFVDLSPLVQEWALATTAARRTKRDGSSQAELQAFYDRVFPRARAALGYLDKVPYGRPMARADENLLNLYLSLAEVVTAVEWYGQPGVVDGYEAKLVRMPVELP